MTAQSASPKLKGLLEYLESLKGRPELDALQQHLEEAQVTVEDLGEFVSFNESGYRRNLVFETDVVELLCLCWKSGQRSPIHNHAESICGVKVVEGIGTETGFAMTPSGFIKATGSRDVEEGSVLVSEDADTHQIANLQSDDCDLVTLHVYSPPLRSMKTWSLDFKKTRLYEPINESYLDGCGI